MVCLVGMPGAGKSTVADGLKRHGYAVVNMGDAVRAEARRQNVEPTGPNLGKIMLELREMDGPGAVANLVRPLVEASSGDTVIVDGIRSDDEIRVLRECGRLRILAIHASSDTRFDYLQKRGRSDDPADAGAMRERDRRELGVGISDPIALADESISNNMQGIDGLVDSALRIIRRWGA
jgi:dephospho-CoA kinase